MKLFFVTTVLGFATSVFSTETHTVLYDTLYDGNLNPVSSVACSTGEYGLETYGYDLFGSFPTYPYIGGAPQVQSWNSPYCGSCWELTYTNPHGSSSSVTFTAINGALGAFTISFAGMSTLTNGNALTLDGVSVTATQLPASACGM